MLSPRTGAFDRLRDVGGTGIEASLMSEEMRHALQKGYEIEGYRIEKVLGAGGFGVTYLAHEISINRKVAIKEYLPSGIAARGRDDVSVHPLSSGDRDNFNWGLERFRQEAKTLVTFRHPNIVSVYRYFEANGTAFLVMAYEEGESLAKILERGATLSESEILEILGPLLSGLEHVHKAGFLHRDIKPGNIYIRRDGSPVLLDFGAARQAMGGRSQSLTSIVSAGYAPFEQYTTRGNQGAWTDIYAFGGVLYRAVTGERPPDAPDRIRNDPYVSAKQLAGGKYSDTLLTAIDAALEVDEDKRPQSVAAWRAMLEGAQPAAPPFASYAGATTLGQTIAAGPGPSMQRPTGRPTAGMSSPTMPPPNAGANSGAQTYGEPRKSRMGLALAVIVGGLVLLGGAGAGAYFYFDSASQAETAALIDKARAAINTGALDEAERMIGDAEKRKKDHPELAGLKERLKSARDAQAVQRREADALIAQARTAIQARNFTLAEQLIERAARALPSHPDLAAIRETLRAARDSATKDQQVRRLADQVRQAIRARNYDEAQRLIDEIVKTAPDHAEIAVLRTELQSARDGVAKEEQVRRLLIQAREAIRAKKFDDAQRLIEEAAKLVPNHADLDAVRRELAAARGTGNDSATLDRLLDEAREAIARRDFDTAKRKLDEAVRISPNDAGIAALRKQIADLQGQPSGERTAVPGIVTSPVNMCRAGSMRFVNATRNLTLPGARYCSTADWKVREVQTDGSKLFWRVIFSDGFVNCQCDRNGTTTGPGTPPPSTGLTPIPGITTTPNQLCVADSQRMLRTTRKLSRPGRVYCTEAQWKVSKTETDGTNVFWEVPFDDGAVYCVCRKR